MVSGVKWYYEHSICDETSSLIFFFDGASAHVEAPTPCGEDDEGNDLTERFVKGEEVELPLGFNYCHCSDTPSIEALSSLPEEPGELRLDEDACKTVHEGSVEKYQDPPDNFFEEPGSLNVDLPLGQLDRTRVIGYKQACKITRRVASRRFQFTLKQTYVSDRACPVRNPSVRRL
ncbi:MAG: hypothetical protein GXP29_02555 [Planctomycetes bacterium]|nr:hypothetical protein [Planctomycetota bacterium]